jgi:hypothetical protein
MATVRLPPQRPGLLQVPSEGKRPALLRRKTREAFQAQTSIHRMKRNKEEGTIIGINVCVTIRFLSPPCHADPHNSVFSSE